MAPLPELIVKAPEAPFTKNGAFIHTVMVILLTDSTICGKEVGVIYRPPTFLISHIQLFYYIFTILLLPLAV